MDIYRFERILLLDKQRELLIAFAQAALRVPYEQQQKFLVFRFIGTQNQVHHPGLDGNLEAYFGYIEALAREWLLALSYGNKGTPNFDVTPLGFKYVEWLT